MSIDENGGQRSVQLIPYLFVIMIWICLRCLLEVLYHKLLRPVLRLRSGRSDGDARFSSGRTGLGVTVPRGTREIDDIWLGGTPIDVAVRLRCAGREAIHVCGRKGHGGRFVR